MDTVFLIISKIGGAAISPESWLVFGIGIALFALIKSRLRLARMVLGITFAATVLLAIFPFGEMLLRPLESRYPNNPELAQVDGIVVLGGVGDRQKTDLWGQTQLLETAERYTAALELARRFPKARIVFTGGGWSPGDLTGEKSAESEVAKAFFIAQGLAADRLLLENRSRNTLENAVNSLGIAQPQAGQTWVLVTSAFHMPRSLLIFEQSGWPLLVPYPVDYRSGLFVDGVGWDLAENLFNLNLAVKEYVGLLVYGLKGR